MRFDLRAAGLAVLLEVLLLAFAAFGGPHGPLGSAPWMLQLPGALLLFYVPAVVPFPVVASAALLVQVSLLYLLISWWRRRRAAAASPT